MDKQKYESPELDIRYFDLQDVISASWETDEPGGSGIVDDDWGE